MTNKTLLFLAMAFGWTWLIGGIVYFADIDLGSIPGILFIALFYMPSPLVAALIAEGGVTKSRLKLPNIRSKQLVAFLLAPVLAILAFAGFYFLIIALFGNALQVPGLGRIATTSEELMKGAANLVGQQAVDEAGAPPPPIIFILATIWGAIVAGWTINALFAMGEEYGWRGLLWESVRKKGFIKANLIVGSVWGLWHMPLILQGYNYPGEPMLGVLLMVVFAIGFSFVLSTLRERTGSVWPAAAAHGMFNALAVMLLIFLVDANTSLAGPLGILGAAIFTVIGIIVWMRGSQPIKL